MLIKDRIKNIVENLKYAFGIGNRSDDYVAFEAEKEGYTIIDTLPNTRFFDDPDGVIDPLSNILEEDFFKKGYDYKNIEEVRAKGRIKSVFTEDQVKYAQFITKQELKILKNCLAGFKIFLTKDNDIDIKQLPKNTKKLKIKLNYTNDDKKGLEEIAWRLPIGKENLNWIRTLLKALSEYQSVYLFIDTSSWGTIWEYSIYGKLINKKEIKKKVKTKHTTKFN